MTQDAVTLGCRNYKGIIITGEGKVFSAGLDLAEIYGFKNIEESRRYFSAIKDLAVTIANCEKPVIALVNGSATDSQRNSYTSLTKSLRLEARSFPCPVLGMDSYP
ncbi:enoyl-CoA hydratase/isomerase family protein [Vulcanisaeta sp. JCM 16159]|uniref:enoyl-CoA hydratase/isomerase family protein n=1 Tax=Vulcanisaeta sp. JCM 16159 TaxID=1295371 RepID=UPI000A79A5F4|nr:enoyl-CoA hydratase/isomerase family protein [Vulcanisaeta sp. JCM 16159]